MSNFNALIRNLLLLSVLGTTSNLLASTTVPTRLVQIKEWPGVSQLITYRDRIWFVSSQPYKDSNSADIYSYTPADGSVQYERSLFSQDAGNPVVHDGLLYWPYEDPRRSAGAGEYAVTDGTQWQWQIMQTGRAMHVHAMDVCDGQLVAVTGSWTGQLLALQENKQWQVQYDYPAGDASFSRLVNVGQFNNKCIVGASARGKKEAKLFGFDGEQPSELSGWPASDRVDSLTVHQQNLYAFADSGNQRELLRFDGKNTTRITLPTTHRPRALHSDGTRLWLATSSSNDNSQPGGIWQYVDGGFKSIASMDQTPVSLTSLHNTLYVGTYSNAGGALWAVETNSTTNASASSQSDTTSYNTLAPATDAEVINQALTDSLYEEISSIVKDPASTDNYARILRGDVARHPQVLSKEFGLALTKLLKEPLDTTEVRMFTRQPVSRQSLIRWYLLTTMAINGHGRVDPQWINDAGNVTSGTSGKLFEPSIAAIIATGWLQQNDNATLGALMQRLNKADDPKWVKADVIGALTAITDQRFAYNVEAWNSWWQTQQ